MRLPAVTPTAIPDVCVIEPRIFADARGTFFEAYNERVFDDLIPGRPRFVQDNHSVSRRHVVRGLHYQIGRPQGKLVRVLRGEVFDVSVDLRRGSKTFAKWVGLRLSADGRQLWIPVGFAHGFLVLSDEAEVLYKTTDYYDPAAERTLQWDDPELGIAWPLPAHPILSPRDAAGCPLRDADVYP